jgi:hypothetical protein
MSRGDHKIEGAPYSIWVEKVEQQSRIRLPKEIEDVVPWLRSKPGTIDCVGSPGPAGGLQIELFAAHDNLRSGFIKELGDASAASLESGERWIEAARLLATSWRIAVNVESNRVSIPLPEPIRRALRLPGAGGTVVVFGFGEIVEVWDAVIWHEYVRGLAKAKISVVSEAIEDIGHR